MTRAVTIACGKAPYLSVLPADALCGAGTGANKSGVRQPRPLAHPALLVRLDGACFAAGEGLPEQRTQNKKDMRAKRYAIYAAYIIWIMRSPLWRYIA